MKIRFMGQACVLMIFIQQSDLNIIRVLFLYFQYIHGSYVYIDITIYSENIYV